jgi:hypothetical protein
MREFQMSGSLVRDGSLPDKSVVSTCVKKSPVAKGTAGTTFDKDGVPHIPSLEFSESQHSLDQDKDLWDS